MASTTWSVVWPLGATDDLDEEMSRDEIVYMPAKSRNSLDADEIEMLQGVFH